MRDHYPNCLVIGDGSTYFVELCQSLRYSTHCNYLVVSPTPPFDPLPYLHINWMKSSSFSFSVLPEDEDILFIHCAGKKIEFSRYKSSSDLVEYTKKINKFGNHDGDNQVILNAKMSFIDMYVSFVKNRIEELVTTKNTTEFNIDIMFDYEGVANVLGATLTSKSGNVTKLASSELHDDLRKHNLPVIGNLKLRDRISSLTICENGLNGRIEAQVEMGRIKSYWPMFRASGINIPLILVQNLLRRKIQTTYLVNPEEIEFDLVNMKPLYIGEYEDIYIDLDETLIWDGIPLEYTIDFLLSQKNNRRRIKLITRHKSPIAETLQRIGLCEGYFDEIIHVPPHEKKSSFIKGKALFIDNEFPERLDVRNNCNIPVFDVDQLDFLSK